MKLLNEFKEFAIKGNAVDMGIGIVIGAAFTTIVKSLVSDIITPLLSVFTSGVDFANWFLILKSGKTGGPYSTLQDAQVDSAITMNFGLFLNAAISFLIVALVLFFVVRSMNRLKRPQKVTVDPVKTKECGFCKSIIALEAIRCPQCTSNLEETG